MHPNHPAEPNQPGNPTTSHTSYVRTTAILIFTAVALLLTWDLYPVITAGSRINRALDIAAMGSSWSKVKPVLEKQGFKVIEVKESGAIIGAYISPWHRESLIALYLMHLIPPSKPKSQIQEYLQRSKTMVIIDPGNGKITFYF